jgi:hypothetical protein
LGKKSEEQYTIVEIPDQWGSQTDVTSILQEASAIKDEKHMYELYHEISHTWNVVPLDPNPSRVESEGLAVFLQYLLMEKLQGNSDALDAGAEKAFQKLKKQFEKNPGASEIPIAEYGAHQLTDLSYNKGMLFFYILYYKVGEKKLMKVIADHNAKHKSGSTLQDFSNSLVANLPGVKYIVDDWLWTNRSSGKINKSSNAKELLSP